MSKAAGLADILSLIGGGGGQVADLEKDLLHTLCKKFPSTEDCKENSVLLKVTITIASGKEKTSTEWC